MLSHSCTHRHKATYTSQQHTVCSCALLIRLVCAYNFFYARPTFCLFHLFVSVAFTAFHLSTLRQLQRERVKCMAMLCCGSFQFLSLHPSFRMRDMLIVLIETYRHNHCLNVFFCLSACVCFRRLCLYAWMRCVVCTRTPPHRHTDTETHWFNRAFDTRNFERRSQSHSAMHLYTHVYIYICEWAYDDPHIHKCTQIIC